LQELINITCVIYINNIFIYSNNLAKYWYYIIDIKIFLQIFAIY